MMIHSVRSIVEDVNLSRIIGSYAYNLEIGEELSTLVDSNRSQRQNEELERLEKTINNGALLR